MKLGAYTAVLHDRPLPDALKVLGELGLTSAEINSGGFLPPVHIPMDDLLASAGAREDYLGPVPGRRDHADRPQLQRQPAQPAAGHRAGARGRPAPLDRGRRPARRGPGGHDVRRAGLRPGRGVPVLGGEHLGQPVHRRPGLPVGPRRPVLAGRRRAGPGRGRARCASRCTRRTSSSTRRRCAGWWSGPERPTSGRRWTRATCSGRGSTRSPRSTGSASWSSTPRPRTRSIHEDNCRIYGVLDERHTRVTENPLHLGGRSYLNRWPADPAWEFVHVGRGHDVHFWARFLTALSRVDPDMAVNIEHEDQPRTTRWRGCGWPPRRCSRPRPRRASERGPAAGRAGRARPDGPHPRGQPGPALPVGGAGRGHRRRPVGRPPRSAPSSACRRRRTSTRCCPMWTPSWSPPRPARTPSWSPGPPGPAGRCSARSRSRWTGRPLWTPWPRWPRRACRSRSASTAGSTRTGPRRPSGSGPASSARSTCSAPRCGTCGRRTRRSWPRPAGSSWT